MATLVFFPFAGATKYSFRPITDLIDSRIDVIVPELPGHGSRFGETLLSNVEDMVQDLRAQISHVGKTPVVVWGHSLGALLAYEYARQGWPASHLIVSGRSAPHLPQTHPRYSKLCGPEFIQALISLGGTPADVIADREVMTLFEPVLRADFVSAESYTLTSFETIETPMTILIGSNDICTPESAAAWSELTIGFTTRHNIEGGHFFPFERPEEVVRAIELAI